MTPGNIGFRMLTSKPRLNLQEDIQRPSNFEIKKNLQNIDLEGEHSIQKSHWAICVGQGAREIWIIAKIQNFANTINTDTQVTYRGVCVKWGCLFIATSWKD